MRPFGIGGLRPLRRQPRLVTRALVIGGVSCWLAGLAMLASTGFASADNTTTIQGNSSTDNVTLTCPDGEIGVWHFVLPAQHESPRMTFVSITATFKLAGTVTYSGPFTHDGYQTPNNASGFTTPGGDTLISATAQVVDPDSSSAHDTKKPDFFVLSDDFCSSPTTPTPTPSMTPSPTPSMTPTPTPSMTPTPTPSPSTKPSGGASPTPSPTPTGSTKPAKTPSPSPTSSPAGAVLGASTPGTGAGPGVLGGGVLLALGMLLMGAAGVVRKFKLLGQS